MLWTRRRKSVCAYVDGMHHLSCAACCQSALLRSKYLDAASANSPCGAVVVASTACFRRSKQYRTAGQRPIAQILPGREHCSASLAFEAIYFGDVRTTKKFVPPNVAMRRLKAHLDLYPLPDSCRCAELAGSKAFTLPVRQLAYGLSFESIIDCLRWCDGTARCYISQSTMSY